ncbi:DUF2190 family protein [Marinovum sp.]|uniref:DUF2190 family protein n=1 Tax=Marinovum sp. TaxID=2024839 RepID=UPI002B268CD4|nr:DUF2190 family protein [Marinovum sp.]
MKNFIAPGEHVTVITPSDVSAGDGLLIGSLFGVVQEDAVTGADVVLVRRGVFILPKTSAQAWTVGAKVYWTGSECTTTASGNTLIGLAESAAANPSATGRVLLDGAVR